MVTHNWASIMPIYFIIVPALKSPRRLTLELTKQRRFSLATLRILYFHFVSEWMRYDRGTMKRYYTFCQMVFTSFQLGFNIIQFISSIGEYFNKLQLGFINFPKWLSKVIKTFKQCFIFNNPNIFSSIAKCFQQLNFWFKQFSLLLFNNCKCFQHSTKQLINLQNVILYLQYLSVIKWFM